MRPTKFSALIFFVTLISTSALADDFLGSWARGDGIVRTVVAPCGNSVCMTNTWIKPGVTDEEVGEKVVFDVKPQGDGVFKGSGFDPQRNVKFTVEIKVSGDRMTTGGCGLGGLVCKNQDWIRIK